MAMYDMFDTDDPFLLHGVNPRLASLVKSDNLANFVSLVSDNKESDSDSDSDSEYLPIGCVGLKNLGNTCYINSILQCLSHTNEFREFILCKKFFIDILINNFKTTDIKELESKYENSLTYQFNKLFKAIYSDKYENISPDSFRNVIRKIIPICKDSSQQDAQEFLQFTLDQIEDEVCYENKEIVITNTKLKELYDNYIKLDDSTKVDYLFSLNDEMRGAINYINYNKKYSIINDIFQNMICSTITCNTCGSTSKTYEALNMLQIDIPEDNKSDDSFLHMFSDKSNSEDDGLGGVNSDDEEHKSDTSSDESCDDDDISTQKCIDLFFSKEQLTGDNMWKCSKCNKFCEANKINEIKKLAPVIIIQLKRFKYNNYGGLEINDDEVYMNKNIDFGKYYTTEESTKYELYSVVNKHGNMHSGHYTAFCKNRQDDLWYNFDDETVTLVKDFNDDSSKESNYILFYRQIL